MNKACLEAFLNILWGDAVGLKTFKGCQAFKRIEKCIFNSFSFTPIHVIFDFLLILSNIFTVRTLNAPISGLHIPKKAKINQHITCSDIQKN